MPGTVGRPMEILLVEDDLVHARIVTETIERVPFNHRTTLICDGLECLDFLYARGVFRHAPRPDLILLDLRLPGMDGVDVLAEIRQDEVLQSIPVVIMTASSEEQDLLACAAHRVEAYLIKPINLEKFLSLLKQLKHMWHQDLVLPRAVVER